MTKSAPLKGPAAARLTRQLLGSGWLLLVCWFAAPAATHAASFSFFSRKADGPAIYKQQCAKCHGPAGQGVKGKYNDPLVGDWSLEKLTRYIAKTMPEDKPGSCTGPHAEAVARYIHDTFYSREARAKSQPARIELVRLTNRQHLLAAADLFRANDEPKLSPGKGLTVAGYKSRTTRREDKVLDRVDATVEFDFGKDRPQWAGTGTNGFALNWSGSVVADESGDYEFVVKTANGIRLWVNDDDKPLIDGSVSSFKGLEHTATLKLIGGRAYPLRLEFFKTSRDPIANVTLSWRPPHGARQVIPARNLAPERVPPTFVLNTPFPADDSSVGYERGVAISKEWDEAVTHAAIEVATFVQKNLDRLSRSKPGDKDRTEKVEAFCAEFAARALRRPLTPEQKSLFVTRPLRSTTKLEDGVKRVVLLTLKSPRFLYLGLEAAGTSPDDFTVAERLAFGLWDSLPDAALLKAAADGQLRTREQVSGQARRMLADTRTRGKVQYFLHRWLQMNHIEDLTKDPSAFPGFTPEIIADLRTSLNLFLDDVVWNAASDYRRLVLEDDFFVNGRLAKFYGVPANAAEEFVRVQLDPKQRSGVITHPYLLAAFSYNKSSSPIHRGVFLTRNIVGRALRPPPMAIAFKDGDFKPGMTMREKITELTRPQACQSCHSVINPLGFALENFDAVGRFRDRDGNRPVDAAADYTTDDGGIVRLRGARDIAEFAVKSEHAHNAFIEQLFAQVVKQPMLAYGSDALNQLRASFVQSSYNIQKLLVDIVTVSALHGVETPASTAKQ